MSTPKQIIANQQNALKSCGPKTDAGKAISAQNARKHGFYSPRILLRDEDASEYARLARGVLHRHFPVGDLEAEIVNTIIQTLWQLRRANRVDTELFTMYRFYDNETQGVGTAFAQDASQGNAFTKLVGYQQHLFRKLSFLKKELQELQSGRLLNVVTTSPTSPIQPTALPEPSLQGNTQQ